MEIMTNQEKFEREAERVLRRHQDSIDAKVWLSHWTGYERIRKNHEKEILALAQKYGVEIELKAWKLNSHFM